MIDGIEQEFSFGKERMVYEETLPPGSKMLWRICFPIDRHPFVSMPGESSRDGRERSQYSEVAIG